MLRELAEQHVGNHEAKDGVAEELHRLVVEDAAAGIFVHARTVRQRVFQQPAIPEPVADAALERLELRSERHDARRPGLVAMAVDDLPGVVAPSSAATAIRSSLRVNGNAVRDRSVAIIALIPCVSSSPRTTSASLCDGVRKTTTRSGRCGGIEGPLECHRARHTASRPADANV